jgi:hypothetical protein
MCNLCIARNVQRYREVLHEFQQTFRRHTNAYRTRKEQYNLLYGQGRGSGGKASNAVDILINERSSLSQSHRAIDDVLQQAAETKEALQRQRSTLSQTTSRLGDIASRFPGVSTLMGSIGNRRTFNDRVVSIAIAIGLFFFFWYFVLRKF